MKDIMERLKNVMSYTEVQISKVVIEEVTKGNKIIKSSLIAEKEMIPKSSLVNAYKLMEVAGVLRTKSLGAKGTNVAIINEDAAKEILGW